MIANQDKYDQFEHEKTDQSPISNHQPQIDFGFKPLVPPAPQIDFGFKPVDVETEDMSPSQVFAPEKKDTTHVEREMAQPTMEPEVVAEINQSVQSVEKGVNLHSRQP